MAKPLGALTVVACLLAVGCSPLGRPEDPVVVEGAALGALRGIPPGQLVAFRADGSGWRQVPVQVDERARVDLA